MAPDGFVPIKFTGDFRESQREACLANMAAACRYGFPIVRGMGTPHGRVVAIAGAGPSLKDYLPALHEIQASGGHVCAVNEAHDWLVRNGLEPDSVVYTEVAAWPEPLFNEKTEKTVYYVSSSADKSTFDHLEGRNIVVWHAWHGVGEEEVVDAGGGGAIVYGGCTPAMRAIHLHIVLGCRRFECFGMESSYEYASHVGRADSREGWNEDPELTVFCAGRTFKTKAYLASQANDFAKMVERYGSLISFNVHGDGLLPHAFRAITGQLDERAIA